MADCTIKTNNQPRYLKYAHEVPEWVLTSQFDWLEDPCDGFIRYKQEWFHLSQFMTIESGQFKDLGYHGSFGDSYFSGTLVRIIDDESVVMARYYS